VIHTDGWPGYYGMEEKAYAHKVSNIKQSGGREHKLMPRVHRVASLMKRWLLGTHQGSISPKRLDYYLDEFTFRFNRRTSKHRGKAFLSPDRAGGDQWVYNLRRCRRSSSGSHVS